MDNTNKVVLIPCLNEETGIKKVIDGFKKEKINQIIVFNGPSKDNTKKNAKLLGAKVIDVRKGKGNGFRDGLKKIKIEDKKIYIMIDGDGTYLPKEINKLIDKNYDIIMGKRPIISKNSRNKKELIKNMTHIIGNLIISFIGSILYLNPTRDICTGYWIFKGSALKKLQNNLTAKNFELEADLFSTANKLKLKIKKFPINYEKRLGESKLNFKDAFIIINKLIRNRL
ncbi:MAG: glycosyltransferase [Candidatus ainarchaeum sp.]|nr:glycosyltransferase [Candidatus ainarchaeum sp.]